MNASFSRRLTAYIIDFIFITAILMIVTSFIPKSENVEQLNTKINELTEQNLNQDISFNDYLNQYGNYLSEIDKDELFYNISNFICVFIYFIIVPLIFKGRTLGKYIMKIKIQAKNGKLNIFNLILRNIIDMGLLYLLVTIFLVQLMPSNYYLYLLLILGFIQIILVIISCFMILYRHDKQGLQDIISLSNVITNEEVGK